MNIFASAVKIVTSPFQYLAGAARVAPADDTSLPDSIAHAFAGFGYVPHPLQTIGRAAVISNQITYHPPITPVQHIELSTFLQRAVIAPVRGF